MSLFIHAQDTKKIIKIIADLNEEYSLKSDEIIIKGPKSKSAKEARRKAILQIKRTTYLSDRDIAEFFNLDISSIIHAYQSEKSEPV